MKISLSNIINIIGIILIFIACFLPFYSARVYGYSGLWSRANGFGEYGLYNYRFFFTILLLEIIIVIYEIFMIFMNKRIKCLKAIYIIGMIINVIYITISILSFNNDSHLIISFSASYYILLFAIFLSIISLFFDKKIIYIRK